MSKNEKKDFSLLAKVINGAIAGMVGIICVFPLDLVKTRLQSQQIGPNGEKMYKNIFDCFRKIYKSEGLIGMYRGSLIASTMVTSQKTAQLSANDFFRYKLTTSDGKLSISRQILAAGSAGIVQTIVTTPTDLLKIQIQNAGRVNLDNQLAKQVTARSIIKSVLKNNGIIGLYKGFWPTALRDISFSSIYFPLFAFLNKLGPQQQNNSGNAVAWWSLLSGFSGASVVAFLITPIDVIKTRAQLLKHAAGEKACISLTDCARIIYQNEGLTAFFKGGLCRIMVIAPLFGIAQMFYFFGIGEAILHFLHYD